MLAISSTNTFILISNSYFLACKFLLSSRIFTISHVETKLIAVF